MATLAQIVRIRLLSHFSVGGAGASDEARFVSEAASVHAHLQPIEFRVKQDKRVRPVKGDQKGEVRAHKCTSSCALLDSGSEQQANAKDRSMESSALTS